MADPATAIASSIDSYGPAVSRRTRTPIVFTKLSDEQSGQYSGHPILSALRMALQAPGYMMRNPSDALSDTLSRGLIQIDPNSKDVASAPGGINDIVRHESVHSILANNPFTAGGFQQAAEATPGYQQFASTIANRMGAPANEVTAYAAEQAPYNSKIAEQASRFAASLEKKDPRMAQLYRAIAGVK